MAEEIKVSAVLDDKISGDLKRLNKNVGSFGEKSSSSFNRASKAATALKVAMGGLAVVVVTKLAKSFISAASEMQDLEVQFKTLLGSTSEAKKRLSDLSKFASTTPFELAEIAKASKLLEQFTEGALSTGDGLRMVGDAAATTAERDFAGLAMWVGRAYDALQNNRPAGEAMARLQELGIISGKARGKIESLQKQASGDEVWNVLRDKLKENEGAMEEMSKTLSGLTSTFQDQLKEMQRQIMSGGATDIITEAMQGLVETMEGLITNNVFEKIGRAFAISLGGILSFIEQLKFAFVSVFVTTPLAAAKVFTGTMAKISESLSNLVFDNQNWLKKLLGRDRVAELNKAVMGISATFTKMDANIQDKMNDTEKWLEGSVERMARTAQAAFGLLPEKEDVGSNNNNKKDEGDDTVEALKDSEVKMFGVAEDKKVSQKWESVKARAEAEQWLVDLELEIQEKKVESLQEQLEREAQMRLEYQMTAISVAQSGADAIFATAENRARAEERIEVKRIRESSRNESEKEKMIEKVRRDAFDEEKKRKIAETFINGAAAMVKAWVNPGYPGAIPLTIAIGAQNTATMAAIASQQYAMGGVVPGATSGDNTLVRANGGEMILTQSDQAKLLQDIRTGNIGRTNNVSINVTGGGDPNETADGVYNAIKQLEFEGRL